MTPPAPVPALALAPRPPRVFLVQREPRKLDPTTAQRVAEVHDRVNQLGWTLTVRTTVEVKIGPASRPAVRALKPRDAAEIYRLAHLGPMLVCAPEKVYIQKDPSKVPAQPSHLHALADFVEHKACHLLIADRTAIQQLDQHLARWQAARTCTGIGDPRALPLHVFDAGQPWPELVDAVGRTRFNRAFGPPRARTDASKRVWEKAVPHGEHVDHVAGHTLPKGVHWDVQTRRGVRLVAAAEVWVMPPRSYLNVGPNASIRVGSSNAPVSKRVWPVPQRRRPQRR